MRIPLLLNLLLVCAIAQAKTDLVVHDAMISEAPPTMTVRGAFMTIENPTTKPIRITKISSPQFASAEIHQTSLQGNVYKMIKQDALVVPAKGKVELKHGGYHLMLFDPKGPLMAGDSVMIVLTLQGGKTHKVKVKVMAAAVDESEQPQPHQHQQ
jgi:periplasmic copper chaperone A